MFSNVVFRNFCCFVLVVFFIIEKLRIGGLKCELFVFVDKKEKLFVKLSNLVKDYKGVVSDLSLSFGNLGLSD